MTQNRLLKLIQDNAATGADTRKIRMDATDSGAHIYVFDVIDSWFGANAADLIVALTAAAGSDVHLHINSPGGDIFEARAMSAAIANYAGKVIAHIDGVCASAATYLALAASEVRITNGGMFMIHQSMTLAFGNDGDLRETADLLTKIDTTIAATYVDKTGKTTEEVLAWMAAETWFTAQEALDVGFVDAIDASTQASSTNWDLSAFNNAPPANAVVPNPAELSNEIASQLQINRNRMRLYQI